MGDTGDITIEILKQIRDEIRSTRLDLSAQIGETNKRLDETNKRLDETNKRLDETNDRLGETNKRLDNVVREQIRHATAIIELAKAQSDFQAEVRYGCVRIIEEIHKLHDRIDNVLTGALGQQVRDNTARIFAVEAEVSAMRRHAG